MRGIVHEVKGDLAMVKIQRKEACGECRACFSGMMKTEKPRGDRGFSVEERQEGSGNASGR